MRQENLPELPVVIVGKDRTRMTCAVIDALKAHIKNADPYFFCVSDRSRAGHDEVIENHLEKIGVSKYLVQRTLPEEERYGWGAAMNIGIASAFDVCREATCALVVDNDWILQKDLDIEKYLYAFAFSSIGAITFKHIYSGTNVSLSEKQLMDGKTYLLRAKGNEPRYSFTAELGCMLITRRMYEMHGKFKENCRTDETEWEFCDWYNNLTSNYKNDKDLWFATDKDLYHTELNGEGHVFTHVGIVSQHEGKHKWDCPEEYKYLSDEKEDEQVCKEAVMNELIRCDDADIQQGADLSLIRKQQFPNILDSHMTPICIDWSQYFDRVYVLFFVDNGFDKMPRLRSELRRVGLLDSPILEWDYGTRCVYDNIVMQHAKRICIMQKQEYVNHSLQLLRVLRRAKSLKYRRILVVEDDVAFLKDLQALRETLDKMPPDADEVQFDKFVHDNEIDLVESLSKSQSANDYFFYSHGHNFAFATCNAYMGAGIDKAIGYMESGLVSCDRISTSRDIKCAVAKKNICVQVLYGKSVNLSYSDLDFLHKGYFNQGIDKAYSDYAVPEGYGDAKIHNSLCHCPRKFISVYAIAKNEASVAARWYDCVKEADEVCVLDTGSTDNTVKILRDLGAKVTVKTYDDWSFAVARNDSMKLVSPEADILFTLDLDETIAPGWRKKLEDAWIAVEEQGKKPVGVFYKYIWSFYPDGREMQSFSIRKIHANGTGQWRYRCHELLCDVKGTTFFLNNFVVEHHQNRQTSRSSYIGLLEKDAREMPENDRSAYYYARELMYAGRWEDAIVEFKRHLSLRSAAWHCERASSMRNIAYCYNHLQNADEYELWLWKAAEEDKTNREATYFLGKRALEQKDYRTAVQVLARCVAITKPSLEYISMPIVWTASPWFLYAQALWWVNRWNEAVEASKKAMEIEPHNGEVMAQYENMKATRDKYAKGAM